MQTTHINILKTLYKGIILFAFVFEMPIMGYLTTRRIACLLAVMSCFFSYLVKKGHFASVNKNLFVVITGFAACLTICVFNSIWLIKQEGNIYYEPRYFVYIILYIVVFSYWCKKTFRDVLEFAFAYISMMILQSFIVFGVIINKSFRLYIYAHFYFGDDRYERTIQWGTRGMGIALDSSAGSVVMSTACLLLIYLILNNKIKMRSFLLMYIIIAAATAFVGRTGFYMELIALLIYLVISCKVSNIISVTIVLAVAFAVINMILSNLDQSIAGSISAWIGEVFNRKTRFYTVKILFGGSIPPISLETILGTNVALGVTPSGAIMKSDSGYAKTYCTIGIVGVAIYYSAFASLYFHRINKIINKKNRRYFIVIVLFAFIIEIKEPYFQKYIFAWFILTLMLLSEKEPTMCERKKKRYGCA